MDVSRRMPLARKASVARAALGHPALDILCVPQGVRQQAGCALLTTRVAEMPEVTQRGHLYAGYRVSTRASCVVLKPTVHTKIKRRIKEAAKLIVTRGTVVAEGRRSCFARRTSVRISGWCLVRTCAPAHPPFHRSICLQCKA